MQSDDKLSLDYIFHPKSIAVAGVSSDTTRLSQGRHFLESLIDAGFEGKLYPFSRETGEVSGLKIYPSIKDVPGTVDYVISAIPAQHIPQLIIDCASKGVKAIHMFTAGFSEIEDEEGGQLQSQITALAQQTGVRIIGPNCMGLYCPKTHLAFHPDFPKESGNIGFISQSGGHSIYAVREAATKGIHFSKVISYGNAADLNESDFLEYLTHDPDTEVITAYFEGVKDGNRFLKTLKQVAKTIEKKNQFMVKDSFFCRFDSHGEYALKFKFGYLVYGYVNQWSVLGDFNKEISKQFKKNKIDIPYPVMVVKKPEDKKKK